MNAAIVSEEKKCPFCAETIKQEAIKCRFCGSDLRPGAGADFEVPNKSPNVAACDRCHVALVPVQKRRAWTFGGVIATFIFLFGLFTLLLAPIGGIVLIVLAILVGMASKSYKTVMVCPTCGATGRTVASES